MATIGKTIRIVGDVSGKEDLVVQGEVEGTVELPDNLVVVAAEGAVRGDVRVTSLEIHGRLAGRVSATEVVELSETSTVEGSISCPRVAMANGSRFNGSIDTQGKPGSGISKTADRT